MERMKRFLKSEYGNFSIFETLFLVFMVLLQVIIYCFIPDTLLGMVCGVSGIICVVLTAKGKISSYLFNFIQMITYMIICWNARLFLEFGEQIFYFIACIAGVVLWRKNMYINEDGTQDVKAKKFKPWQWAAVVGITVMTTILFGMFGGKILGGTLPYLDAFTVSLSVIAQLLMIWRYREQWAVWIIINISSLIMFTILEQWSMTAMYIAWTINAIYGWYNWTKLERRRNV